MSVIKQSKYTADHAEGTNVFLLNITGVTKDKAEAYKALKEKYPDVKIELLKDTLAGQKTVRHAAGIQADKKDISVRVATGMPQPGAALTKREIEIIKMAGQEFNSGEIAARLDINIRTVETHRKRIMVKTNCKNFIGVILYALKHNYLSLEDFS